MHEKRTAVGSTAGLAIIALLVAATALPAEAGRRSYDNNRPYVVAESRFGNGYVIGPVRHTRVGPQVRTPGGSWIHCERSCAETLRVNTVDFWENEQGAGRDGAIDSPDGVLGKWLHFERRY